MDHSFDILKSMWRRISLPCKAAFLAGLVSGVITHLYVMTNKLPNWDELLIGFQGGGYYFGRYLSDDYHFLFSGFSSPGVNGFMTVLLLSLAAAMAVYILRIRSMTGAVLTGVMLVTFPSVCSSMTYMYVAPVYALMLVLITMAVIVTMRFRFGFLPAAVLIVLSMAGYQAYFPYATALFVLALIVDVMEGRAEKEIIRQGFLDLIALAIGIAGYLLSLNLLHVEVADYRGMQDIGSSSMAQYVRAVIRAYHRLLEYFVTDPLSYAQGSAHRWNMLAFGLLMLLAALVLLRKEVHGQRLRLFMYVVFTALMPLSIGLIYVMSVEVQDASPLMIYPYCLVYVWLIVLAEHLSLPKACWQQVLAGLCVLTLVMVGYENYRVSSDSYYRMYIANKRVYGLYNRIVSRLEEQEGFAYGDKVRILGAYDKSEAFPLDTYQLRDATYADLEGVTLETNLFMEPTREYYLRLFLGIETPYQGVSDEEVAQIRATQEYQEMPYWPAEGSIERIHDVWIVKMAED